MTWYIIVALVVAIPVILFPAAYVGYLTIGGLYAAIKERQKKRAGSEQGLGITRTLTAVGRKIRRAATLTLPTASYGLLIWLLLAGFGWQIALAVGLAIPVLAVPVVFVWYLHVSGVYQVIRDRMHRQRVRAEALKEAEEIIQVARAGKVVGETVKEEVFVKVGKSKRN